MIQWEYFDHFWRAYDAPTSAALENSFAAPAGPPFSFLINGRPYDVDFTSMAQTNLASGFSRPVRRAGGAAPAGVAWVWRDDRRWKAFDGSAIATLEAARAAGRAAVTLHVEPATTKEEPPQSPPGRASR